MASKINFSPWVAPKTLKKFSDAPETQSIRVLQLSLAETRQEISAEALSLSGAMEQKLDAQGRRNMDVIAQGSAGSLMASYMKSFSLKAAIELGIADIIHRHGRPLTASQLAAKIPISSTVDVSCLDRLMRFLVYTGVFAQVRKPAGEEAEEVSYGLTPVSSLMVRDNPHCFVPLVMLSLHPLAVAAWDNLGAWFRSEEGCPSAFEAKHGEPFWLKASTDAAINKVFNDAMSSTANLSVGRMIAGCSEVFEGVRSLVDVGGGIGTLTSLIANAFPHIKCMVLDQPHVVAASSPLLNVVAIGGDMFESIPPADAVLLKEIFHDWDDKSCIKLLTRCKEAIPKPGGKVIVVDVVRKKCADQVFDEVQLMLDLHMMVLQNGKERSEEEWKKLFTDAGFSGYKIVTSLGAHAVIEVFP
ncbi:Trans-resveratrol di-O-methyltransferase [Nymphaea thermarum]|nr:Trans-resveratrol di-O-methyltransferase [Nymphaea thermarum]